ncbi:MAG: division/cell wall cluster transcriptional repressor MraZ [Erysipelotrichaceae bacterium]
MVESGDSMFMGEYFHTIDAKGRIVIPARFRDAFSTNLVTTKGFDGCLNIYTKDQFQKIAEKLSSLPNTKREARNYIRLFLSKAMECEIDGQNRINLSKSLILEAQLAKQCVFIGAADHIELWSTEKWENWEANNNASFEDVAESLTDFMV